MRLLSNLTKRVSGKKIARMYRERWSIERMFQRLESVLESEVRSLGYPRAALLAFGVAVVGYNVLSVVQAAVEEQHQIRSSGGPELSSYYIAAEIRANYGGMMIAVVSSEWEKYQALSPKQLDRLLCAVAEKVEPGRLRNHPRGPKIARKIGYVPGHLARSHVSTARVLRAGRVTK